MTYSSHAYVHIHGIQEKTAAQTFPQRVENGRKKLGYDWEISLNRSGVASHSANESVLSIDAPLN